MASDWTVQQSGEFTQPSDETDSPWYDAGAQTALARYPDADESIDDDGTHIVTFANFRNLDTGDQTQTRQVSQNARYGPTP